MRKTLLILLASVALACAQDWDYMQYQLDGIYSAVQDLQRDTSDSGSTGGLYGIDLWIWSVGFHTQQCLRVMADHNWDARILINNPELKEDATYLTRDYGFTKEQVGEEIVKAAAGYWNMDREQARAILSSYIREAYIPVKRAIPVNKGGISFGR
jgi:hypothetical protein